MTYSSKSTQIENDTAPLPPLEPARWRMLHFTWLAFFLTFVVWFNLAPFKSTIGRVLHLSEAELNTLLICNVALTIPARIAIGMLVDRFGPRRVYTGLLLSVALPCFLGAFATHYWQMVVARLLVSCVGAGFVVGIRLVSEWFDAREIGWAEGIYGGLGNFGMAAATFGLPLLALLFGKENGWRWAMAVSGLLCLAYAGIFYRNLLDAPPGKTFRRPRGRGALEVSSRGALLSLVLLQWPMVICLGLLAWKLVGVHMISKNTSYVIYALLGCLLAHQVRKILHVNADVLKGESPPVEERYSFSQVAILCLCYAVTFGGELAVESMLPAYFEKMFNVSVALAGVMGAGFAFASLIARPLGGYLGDKLGRKPVILVSLGGSAAGFFGLLLINHTWPLPLAMGVIVLAGVFLMAGNGANFCIAPLIRKPLTGQIAGLIGAYGNVGSVSFLTVLALFGAKIFFITMTVTGVFAFLACFLLSEPARKPAAVVSTPIEIEEPEAELVLAGA